MYAAFFDEILPSVEDDYRLSDDPDQRISRRRRQLLRLTAADRAVALHSV
jgi:hypothetical protein